jgi:hypothetical protein
MKTIAICLLLTVHALTGAEPAPPPAAAPVGIEWDRGNPPEVEISEFRVYRETDTGKVLIATVAGTLTQAAVDLPADVPSTLTVTAWNGRESGHSDPLVIAAVPEAPQGLRVKITISLDTSSTLAPDSWKEVATIVLPGNSPAQFFRTRTN